MKKILLSLCVITVALSSCLSDLNLNPDSSAKYPANWSIPLIHAHLDLGNLVGRDSLTSADPDGLVHIIYRDDSLLVQNVYDFTKVPDQEPMDLIVTVGSPDININTNLGTFGGAKMKSITLNTGRLEYETYNPESDTVQISVTLLNTNLNGQVANFIIDAVPGNNYGTIYLSGLHFDLTQGNPAYNNIGFELGIVDTTVVPNGTDIDVKLQFKNFSIEEAIGYFGDRKINIPGAIIPTNLSILDNLTGGLYLANPQVKLYTRSNIGLSIQLSPDIVGVNKKGKSVDLALQPYLFTGAASVGSFARDTFEVNVGNSQIDQFIANVPVNLVVSGDIILNPNGEPQNDNFITNDGELLVGLEIDLPLELKTENLTIEQTIYDIDFGVEPGDVDFVEKLTLGFRVENAFPLDADLHFYFQDSTGAILDSTFIALFDAAVVDGNGNVTAPAKSDRYLIFSDDKIKTILKSNDIRIKVVLNTSNGGTQVVRLLTDYYIDFIVGVQAKMNYKL